MNSFRLPSIALLLQTEEKTENAHFIFSSFSMRDLIALKRMSKAFMSQAASAVWAQSPSMFNFRSESEFQSRKQRLKSIRKTTAKNTPKSPNDKTVSSLARLSELDHQILVAMEILSESKRQVVLKKRDMLSGRFSPDGLILDKIWHGPKPSIIPVYDKVGYNQGSNFILNLNF